MKHAAPLAALALVLAACAPAYSIDRVGRIVNVTTGEEGQIRLGGSLGMDNSGMALITFGPVVYSGSYNVLAAGSASSVTLGASFGFGTGAFGFGYGDPFPRQVIVRDRSPRQGSAIVKNGAGAVISCTFSVDDQSHGNGTCEDGKGQKYAFQF